jgi:hypothetical protein
MDILLELSGLAWILYVDEPDIFESFYSNFEPLHCITQPADLQAVDSTMRQVKRPKGLGG